MSFRRIEFHCQKSYKSRTKQSPQPHIVLYTYNSLHVVCWAKQTWVFDLCFSKRIMSIATWKTNIKPSGWIWLSWFRTNFIHKKKKYTNATANSTNFKSPTTNQCTHKWYITDCTLLCERALDLSCNVVVIAKSRFICIHIFGTTKPRMDYIK